MNYYFIDVNDLYATYAGCKFDYLTEKYPTIKEEYYKKWYLENMALIRGESKKNNIEKINTRIKQMLDMYNIPEKVLLVEIKEIYIEPLSKTALKINPELLQEASDAEMNEYIE